MKKAFVKPLIKRDNLDVDNLSNFRPISQLPLFSKILERVVVDQISNFFDSHSILDNFQSAYSKHNYWNDFNCISNNILCSNKGTLLILLDICAAFDTLIHKFLISCLLSAGIYGDALNWFVSYKCFSELFNWII